MEKCGLEKLCNTLCVLWGCTFPEDPAEGFAFEFPEIRYLDCNHLEDIASDFPSLSP